MSSARLLDHCIFCGRTDDLTEEHIVADWVARAFFGMRKPPKHFSGRFVGPDQLQMAAEEPADTARVLCRPCNNEWVSGLDRKAAEALRPLINGKTTVALDPLAQASVAAWIFKSALVFDAVEHGDTGPLVGLRTEFHETQRPPVGCTIYLGPAPRTTLPIPGLPADSQIMMMGVKNTSGTVNVRATINLSDGTQTTSNSTVPSPGYTVMLGRVHAIISGLRAPIIPTPEWKFACVWPTQSDAVELVSVPKGE